MRLRNPLERFKATAAELRREDERTLATIRKERKKGTTEFPKVMAGRLAVHGEANGVVRPAAAQVASQEAQYITDQHEIVVRAPEVPAAQIPVAVAPHEERKA